MDSEKDRILATLYASWVKDEGRAYWKYSEPATEQALRDGGFSDEQIAELKSRNCVKGG